jgi:putative FmdB family regulatory protein
VPIYEYKCRKCEAVLERIHGMSDKPLSKCPSCGGKVDRMMSTGAFQFKGSGFYATDYAKKGEKPASCPAASGGDPPAACGGCPKASGE